ncbi:MAG: STAS domain-containing protein [Armatimonadetes bacterium]|nr:STAS domain-containing protein [Armatimonadota bacterium]
MRIQVRDEDAEHAICSLSGELDAYTAPDLREALDKLLDEGYSTVVVDMNELQYLDSTGLGILVGTAKKCRQAGGDLAVVCTRPNLLKIFNISGTQEILNVTESVDAAAARLAQLHDMRKSNGGEQGEEN